MRENIGSRKSGKMKEQRKRKRGVRYQAALGLALAALLCSGCGSTADSVNCSVGNSKSSSSESFPNEAGYGYGSGSYDTAGSGNYDVDSSGLPECGEIENADSLYGEQKLIRTVDLSVETKEFDQLMDGLGAQVKQLGGYIENLEKYNGSSYSGYRFQRYANLTLRIPREKLDGFLETVSGICNVVRQSENEQDVTLSYVDMESRRNALKTEQERLLEFMEQAQTMEDIISIESRLSEVRYQLESMESQLRALSNQVEYSTVYLDVSEVRDLTQVEEQTTGERIVSGFGDSLKDIGRGIVEFAVWFVVNIPYFILWAVVISLAVLVIRKIVKHKKGKKLKQTAEEKKQNE